MEPVMITINGEKVDYEVKNGYALISRKWRTDDDIVIDFPMPVRRIKASEAIGNDRNKVALQRGPLLYCLEGIDQSGGKVFPLYLPDSTAISPRFRKDPMGGIVVLKTSTLTAIPYCLWNNRGPSEMAVWIPMDSATAIPVPEPTIASRAVATASTDWAPGLNDQFEPGNSSDTDKSFFYWWLKKGTEEWVQYDFDSVYSVSEVKVYWFVFDHYDYVCRPPAEWRILYQKGGEWIPVSHPSPYSL
jgi:hypothetical protein